MKRLVALTFACILLTGCITIGSSPDVGLPVEEEEPEILRLTQEKIQEEDGVQYIIVTFPKQSTDHEGFIDEETGEYVVIGVLSSVQ